MHRPQVGQLADDLQRLRPLSRPDRATCDHRLAVRERPAQNGAPPFEELCYTNPRPSQEYGIKIGRFASAGSPRFDLFVFANAPIHTGAAASVTEPGSSPNALAVGAVCWSGFGLEPYSSRGPNINGVVKPDISGYDSVSSSRTARSTVRQRRRLRGDLGGYARHRGHGRAAPAAEPGADARAAPGEDRVLRVDLDGRKGQPLRLRPPAVPDPAGQHRAPMISGTIAVG